MNVSQTEAGRFPAEQKHGALGRVGPVILFLPMQVIDGEVYPPSLTEVPVSMSYPPHVPMEQRLAIGQEVFGLLPGLGFYATLWLREHNRLCDILKAEHPTWDDEQLFQTARLIVIGECSPCMEDALRRTFSFISFTSSWNSIKHTRCKSI